MWSSEFLFSSLRDGKATDEIWFLPRTPELVNFPVSDTNTHTHTVYIYICVCVNNKTPFISISYGCPWGCHIGMSYIYIYIVLCALICVFFFSNTPDDTLLSVPIIPDGLSSSAVALRKRCILCGPAPERFARWRWRVDFTHVWARKRQIDERIGR